MKIMKNTILGIGVFVLIIGMVIFAFSFLELPHTITEPYQVPKSSPVINESFTVPPTNVIRTASLTEGDSLHIEVEVTSGGNKDIDFYVMRGDGAVYVAATRVTTIDRDWTVPSSGTFGFVYDNSFSWITSKEVTTKVTKHWTETDYREVTEYYPLFPHEFSYVGVILSLVGIGIMILAFFIKGTSKTRS